MAGSSAPWTRTFRAAHAVIDRLTAAGIDMRDVTRTLEEEGVASFSKSFDELITSLETKADALEERIAAPRPGTLAGYVLPR